MMIYDDNDDDDNDEQWYVWMMNSWWSLLLLVDEIGTPIDNDLNYTKVNLWKIMVLVNSKYSKFNTFAWMTLIDQNEALHLSLNLESAMLLRSWSSNPSNFVSVWHISQKLVGGLVDRRKHATWAIQPVLGLINQSKPMIIQLVTIIHQMSVNHQQVKLLLEWWLISLWFSKLVKHRK